MLCVFGRAGGGSLKTWSDDVVSQISAGSMASEGHEASMPSGRQSGDSDKGTAAAAAASGNSGAGGVMGKPNVFFIMIDDMGWNDIGYQSTDLKDVTPNLDKLAAGGVKVRVQQ